MSDYIAVMNGGHLEQVGPPDEIYERPVSRFVAGFIGTSNVLEGTAGATAQGWTTVEGPGLARVRVSANGFTAGDPVAFTVRPEKLQMFPIGSEPDGDDRCRLHGRVTDIVYQGVSTQYIVDTDAGDAINVFVQNRHDSEDLALEDDEVVCLWRPAHNVVLHESSPEPAADASAGTGVGDEPAAAAAGTEMGDG